MNLLKFLYWLQKKEFYLWTEQDTLKFKQLQPLKNKARVFALLKDNKKEIIDILRLNNVLSSDIKYPFIYKLDREIYNLSFAQERLFFIDQYENGTNAYNMPCLLKVTENAKLELIKNTFIILLKKHEILTSIFTQKKGNIFQVKNNLSLKFNEYKLQNKKELLLLCEKLSKKIFNLSVEIPIEISIIGFKNEFYIFSLIHHIAFDGWSSDLFFEDFKDTYFKLINNEHSLIDFLSLQNQSLYKSSLNKIQYGDFSEWQKCYLTGEKLQTQLNFWKKKLNDYKLLEFPIDYNRPKLSNFNGNQYTFTINKQLSLELRNLAKDKNTTLFCVLLSAFYILLSKYTQQDDLIVGTPIANRQYPQIKNIIGFFVNSIPLRIKIDSDQTVSSLIDIVSNTTYEAQEHQDIPFEKLVSELNIQRSLNRHPLFDVMFSVQNFTSEIDNRIFHEINDLFTLKTSHFDFSLFINDSSLELLCKLNYSTTLFSEKTIKNISVHYQNILESFAKNINKYIKNICILSSMEFQTIVYDWNKTDAPYPSDKTIHQLFEEQVEKTPDNIAIVFEDKKITYRELNNKANQLAHIIKNEYKEFCSVELDPDTLIGIYIERSLEMIIGILAILKSGAAYVPFDKADPQERLKFKINDCGCKMILTSSEMVEALVFLTESDTMPVSIDSNWKEISKAPISNPVNINKPNDLCYVIYTSGSTGNPKGTMIEHKSVINFLSSINSKKQLVKNFNSTLITNYVFDVSIHDIFCCLLYSGKLHILKDKILTDFYYFNQQIIKNKIHSLFVPSYYLEELNKAFKNNVASYHLERMLVGVNPISYSLLKSINYQLPALTIINGYGPTEATICSTFYIINNNNEIKYKKTPIGTPLNNTYVYILDNNCNPVPLGATGELYIGGECLSRGYLNSADLTNAKFICNPFIENSIFYKTGDLCKYHPDGNIEFIGRNDSQIKINGFRIELGEIETNILDYGVSDCIVLSYHNETTDTKVLTAYYTIQSDGINFKLTKKNILFENDLKEYLQSKLPEYMVPNIFIRLDKMPLNTSGKIDKKALPKPEEHIKKNLYIPPETDLEKKLVRIWENLLGIKKIGINDDFFKIGGNSILAIKLVSKINNYLNTNFKVADIFKTPTIKKIGSTILGKNSFINNNYKEIIYKYQNFKNYINNLNFYNLKTINKDILLTGANGFLGIYLLEDLLKSTSADIYCLIREDNNKTIEEKFFNSITFYKKEHLLKNDRIKLIKGNLSEEKLGINAEIYSLLKNKINLVYHNGANVNHLYNIKMLFDENVKGTFEVIKFSATAIPKKVFYISTFGVNQIPQIDIINEELFSKKTGYEQTKYLSEQILLYTKSKGLTLKIFRLGNITGDINSGVSNYYKNHSLLILKSCIQLGIAPKINSLIEMTPVNNISKSIVSISLSKDNGTVYNLNNPNTISWIEYINKINKLGYKVKLVDIKNWINEISKINENNALYPFKEYYLNLYRKENQNLVEHSIDSRRDDNQEDFNSKYPKDYEKMIETYIYYLQKVKFLPLP